MQQASWIMKRPPRGHRLILHRETLRALTARDLARAGGGADPCPKSTAWTGSNDEIGGDRADRVCTGP
jgi:hypothetical protein